MGRLLGRNPLGGTTENAGAAYEPWYVPSDTKSYSLEFNNDSMGSWTEQASGTDLGDVDRYASFSGSGEYRESLNTADYPGVLALQPGFGQSRRYQYDLGAGLEMADDWLAEARFARHWEYNTGGALNAYAILQVLGESGGAPSTNDFILISIYKTTSANTLIRCQAKDNGGSTSTTDVTITTYQLRSLEYLRLQRDGGGTWLMQIGDSARNFVTIKTFSHSETNNFRYIRFGANNGSTTESVGCPVTVFKHLRFWDTAAARP